jgi:aspartyl-tRNA(Asn)/glutamyl-tRNA(Gln) amidotransferase subunit A
VSDDRDRIRAVADRLGFEPPAELLEQSLETARSLRETAAELDAPDDVSVTTEPEVEPSDDRGALLATYEDPRREAETGPLAGETVAVKDNIAAADLPMTCGSERVATTPAVDAAVVERLLAAGGTLVGKTNMDAFALGPSGEFSDYARVENPVAPDRVPGGTSSGSGVAVAAGRVDAALGTDTGGSIRIPAACCEVVGVKPTHGYVPRHGFVSFGPSLDTIGPLARDVDTAARALAVTSGADPRDPTSAGTPPSDPADPLDRGGEVTVGLPGSFFGASDDGVAEAVRSAVGDAPLDATPVSLPLGAVEAAYFLIGATEFIWYVDQGGTVRGQGPDYSAAVRAFVAASKETDLGDHITRRVLPSAYLDAETDGDAYWRARREAISFRRRVDAALSEVDALVLPTIRTLPPEYGQMGSVEDMLTLLGNTAPFNLSGHPATSVPVERVDGLPVSAQVVGPRFGDLDTLSIAARLTHT